MITACDCPNCCNCGGEGCGCPYCSSCNMCDQCRRDNSRYYLVTYTRRDGATDSVTILAESEEGARDDAHWGAAVGIASIVSVTALE